MAWPFHSENFFQTDKAVVAMEADEDATLAKIIRLADSGPIQVKRGPGVNVIRLQGNGEVSSVIL